MNQLIIQTDMPFKTLESKETRAQREKTVTHNSVFAAHRLDAVLQPQDGIFLFLRVVRASRMIIEMRTYKIKAGHRSEFLETLESKAFPEHQKIGMKVLGPFLSTEDHDTFFWMRGFPDLQSRQRMRDEFYEGKFWKAELEQKLMPNLEKFDVAIVDAPNGLGDWR